MLDMDLKYLYVNSIYQPVEATQFAALKHQE